MEENQQEVIVLDLGCGQRKITPDEVKAIFHKEATKIIGVDFVKTDDADVVHDLTQYPLPFENESVDFIYSSHFLEHLDGFERMEFLNELHRILKPEGKIRFIHPYYKSVRAIQDPTHKFPPISENSYWYFNKQWRDINKLDHYPLTCNFNFWVYYTFQDAIWSNKSEETRNFAINHYFNVVADMIVDLQKI